LGVSKIGRSAGAHEIVQFFIVGFHHNEEFQNSRIQIGTYHKLYVAFFTSFITTSRLQKLEVKVLT
jgi:hypothetical protein